MPQNQQTQIYTKNDPYIYSTGVADVYVLDQIGPTYFDGQEITVRIHATNTGASTVNIQNRGAIPLKKEFNQGLIAGDIQAGQIINARFDKANNVFQIIGGLGGTGESNSGVNLGAGAEVYKQKVGTNLQFRSLTSQGVKAFEDGDEIKINAPYVTVGNAGDDNLGVADYDSIQDAVDDGHTQIVMYSQTENEIDDIQIDFSAGAGDKYHIYGMVHSGSFYDLRFSSASGIAGAYINTGDKSVYFHNMKIFISLNATHEDFLTSSAGGVESPVVFNDCIFQIAAANTGNNKYLFDWQKSIGSGCNNCTFTFQNPFGDLVWITRNANQGYAWLGGNERLRGPSFNDCLFTGGSVMFGDELGRSYFNRCQYVSASRGGVSLGYFDGCTIKFISGTLESYNGDGAPDELTIKGMSGCTFEIDGSVTQTLVTLIFLENVNNSKLLLGSRDVTISSGLDYAPFDGGFNRNDLVTTGDIIVDHADIDISNNIIEAGDIDITYQGTRIISNKITIVGAITNIAWANCIVEGNNFSSVTGCGIAGQYNRIIGNYNIGDLAGGGDDNVITSNTNMGTTVGMVGAGNIIANNT